MYFPVVARCTPSGAQETWIATELHRIGKNEALLQNSITRSPGLLGLESRRKGIHGPFVPFLERPLPTPTGRLIYPDIVFLTGSGHVVIVEVKLSNNPELRERNVIAQIIDYASSVSRLDEDGICRLFEKSPSDLDWTTIIQSHFPDEPATSDLADTLADRMKQGEVNIVIACDRLPAGTASAVAGISSQRALGFTCDVVEIIPYVQIESPDAEIIFAPVPRVATEIVARTAVTVTYESGHPQPSTNVEVTSPDDIKSTMDELTHRGRLWTDGEVEAAIREFDNASLSTLLDFCKQNSIDGTISTAGEKSSPCFGYHLMTRLPNGKVARKSVFSCMPDWRSVYFYLDTVRRILPPDKFTEFAGRFEDLSGVAISDSTKQPRIALSDVISRFDEFTEFMLWVKSNAGT